MGFLILRVPYIVQKLIYKTSFTCTKVYTHQTLVIWNMFRHNRGAIIMPQNATDHFEGATLATERTPWRWCQRSAETCSRLISVWCAYTLSVKWGYGFVTEHDWCLFGQDTAPPLCGKQTVVHSGLGLFLSTCVGEVNSCSKLLRLLRKSANFNFFTLFSRLKWRFLFIRTVITNKGWPKFALWYIKYKPSCGLTQEYREQGKNMAKPSCYFTLKSMSGDKIFALLGCCTP